jgi:hypothetical protein
LSYPFQRIWQVRHSFPGAVSGARFVETHSPWPGPFPPQPPPTGLSPALVRLLLRYYWPVRLPTSVHRSRTPLGLSARTLAPSFQDQTWDLPVPVREASMRARGLRPRGAGTPLALPMCPVLPSVQVDAVGTPKYTLFRGSIPGPHFPLSTLRIHPCERIRMTRGRSDSLDLHRMKLSFTTSRRFYRRTNVRVYLENAVPQAPCERWHPSY